MPASDAESEPSITFSQMELFLCVFLSWIGLFMGIMFIELAVIGFTLIWAAIILRWPAMVYRDDREFSSKIYSYAYALAALGIGMMVGGVLQYFVFPFY